MKIRSEQMQVMHAASRASFEQRMAKHMEIRSKNKDALSLPQLRERTRHLIEVAEKHGVDDETAIRRFLELVFDQAVAPLDDPEIARILTSSATSSFTKISFIADVIHARERA